MHDPRTPFPRGHLWLVSFPPARGPAHGLGRRVAALLPARVALGSTPFVRWLAFLARLPRLLLRATLGRRLKRRSAKEARIIPFEPRRRAAR